MQDYQSMYYKLFNAITDATQILQKAQQTAEEIYILSEEKEYIEQDSEKSDHR